jgi:hypothetical protein
MPTALIPEVIQPGVLYAPSANNFFSIVAANCPNTDDSLLMSGAGPQRYKAYQPAINGIHYGWGSGTGEAAITFWMKAGSTGGTQSGFNSANTLMGVHNQNYANTGSWSNANLTGLDANIAWGIAANTSVIGDRLMALAEWRRTTTSTDDPGNVNTTGATSTSPIPWVFHVWNRTTTGVWSYWRDAVLNATGGTPVAWGSTPWGADLFFSLGAFSFAAGPNNPPYNTTIAKISIHNAQITNLEQIDLLDSMLNGPPSP